MFPFSGYAAKAGMGFFKRIYARFLLRNAVVRSDRLIAVSEATRAEIHAHVRWKGDRKKKISVIRHYIDPVFKKTGGGPAVSLGRYLLYVGNVKPHKNIVGILGALRLTIRNNAGIKLVIAGKKDGFITGMKDWDRQLDLLGIREKVTFTGALPDRELVSLYSHALALVFPSFYEGFGYPPLEAMACGCPVVAADIPPLRETCGNAAVYANPFSVTGIANGIKKALDGKNRKKLVILGKKNVLRFGKKEVTEKYGKFLDSLLKTENEDV
jgi:glycosyltransferase involved in cell wall biosynthesis